MSKTTKKFKSLRKKVNRKKQIKRGREAIAKAKKLKKLLPLRLNLNKRIILLSLLFVAGPLLWLFWGTPFPGQLSNEQSVSTKSFDRNGKLIYEIFADERRTPLKLEELPEEMINATIAIEDRDFYKHHGFSITGIARAIYKNIFRQKFEGGSTLTQQLVKNTLLSPERTFKR